MPPETIALAPVRAKPLPRFHRAAPGERPAFKLTERDREMPGESAAVAWHEPALKQLSLVA